MGILGSIFRAILTTAENNTDRYYSGYDQGSQKASRMSDDELRDSLRQKANNGVSDWRSAGQFKAMKDEYENRK